MKKDDKILIDTSIWIEYFRNKESTLSILVDEILTDHDVYVPKIVLAELIQGARSEKEIAAIESFADAFHVVDGREDAWLKAGKLSYALKKEGKNIHIVDCFIAVVAQEYECGVLTLDKHFSEIQGKTGLRLIPLPG